MAIPTLEEFTEFLNFGDTHRPECTLPPDHWAELPPHVDEITGFMVEFWKEWERIHIQLKQETAYSNWIARQPNYQSAIKTAFRQRRRGRLAQSHEETNIEGRAIEDAKYIVARFEADRAIFRNSHFGVEAKSLLDKFWVGGTTWVELNARALMEYFHTDHAVQSLAQKKELIARYERARKAVEELVAGLNEVKCESLDLARAFGGDIYDCEVLDGSPRAVQRFLTYRHVLPRWMQNPIRRSGELVREQLLVYRYWQMHKRWGKFSAAVVRDLMYVEGIDHQYNDRTIERMYKEFTDAKAAQTPKTRRDG